MRHHQVYQHTYNGSHRRGEKSEIFEETMAENLPNLMKESTH